MVQNSLDCLSDRGTIGVVQVGRPHIGRTLVARGHATSVTDAFAKYLSDDQLQLGEWSLDIVRERSDTVILNLLSVLAD